MVFDRNYYFKGVMGIVPLLPFFFGDLQMSFLNINIAEPPVKAEGVTCKEHEWVVFSTALKDCCLMLECVNCGLYGTVDDPSKEEWSKAFHAPLKPYRWDDEARVRRRHQRAGRPRLGVKPTNLLHVQKKPPSARTCDCNSKLGVLEPGDYERVWIEGTRPKPEITPEARKELLELAEMADGANDLCSTFFPLFVEGYQQATGHEPNPRRPVVRQAN